MIKAINNKKNWMSGNTEVFEQNGEIFVKLHGHLIAKISAAPLRQIQIYDAGYQTKTTKSRLNAILDHFYLPRISQRDFVWYLDNEVFEGTRVLTY